MSEEQQRERENSVRAKGFGSCGGKERGGKERVMWCGVSNRERDDR